MPFVNSMMRVALPVIRDHFEIRPDMTAWVVTAFSLPFVILSTVYGRLSDGLGQRRLILIGAAIFCAGTAITLWAPGLGWLMAGRAIQGLGTGGMFPMAMALISLVYDPRQRGKVLGAWSTTGPATGFVAPVLTGLVIERWGWRAAIVPALILGALAFAVVYRWIPTGLRTRPGANGAAESSSDQQEFLRAFDWLGMGLLAAWITTFLFYLSSRPITGVPPLQDWRLLGLAVALGTLFVWWESRRSDPFVDFGLFRPLSLPGVPPGFSLCLAAPLYAKRDQFSDPTLPGGRAWAGSGDPGRAGHDLARRNDRHGLFGRAPLRPLG
jgi:MFS family permease